MTETAFFLEHDDARLLAVMHEPRAERKNGRGVVFCAPFGEEAAISQKVCVDFARVLARRGYRVLRFDYRGCGDSSGMSEEFTPTACLADIRAATDWLRRHGHVRIGLFGLRLGAALADMAAAHDPDIEFLLLWEPVPRLEEHLKNLLRARSFAEQSLGGRSSRTREMLRQQLEGGETVDVLGYPLSPRCYREFIGATPWAETDDHHVPTLVVAIGRQKRPRRDLDALVECLNGRARPTEYVQVQERPFWVDPGDPWRELTFWQGHDGLFQRSAEWLDEVRPQPCPRSDSAHGRDRPGSPDDRRGSPDPAETSDRRPAGVSRHGRPSVERGAGSRAPRTEGKGGTSFNCTALTRDGVTTEEAVQFVSRDKPLLGILHWPASSLRDTGVVFINAGARSRRGPSRLYVRFARRLCDAGYPVLRYDPPGVGDSPGELHTVSAYKAKFLDCSDDGLCALDFLQQATGLERFAMIGLCGGAYSAMMAVADEPRVQFLVLASLPVQDVGDFSEEAVTGIIIHEYFRKVWQWRSWKRLLLGKSSYRWMLRAARSLLSGRYHPPVLNETLLDAFRRFGSAGGKTLIVYGTRDALYPPFAAEFQSRLEQLDPEHFRHEVHLIAEANHTFAQFRWQQELIDHSVAWLERVCDAGPTESVERKRVHVERAF